MVNDMKRILMVSISLLILLSLCSCGTADMPDESTDTATTQQSSNNAYSTYLQGVKYADNKDWLSAYACFLSVAENDLIENKEYAVGDLEKEIKKCHTAAIDFGKNAFDTKDYLSAYQYWTICHKNETLDYSEKYTVTKYIYNVQGVRFDRQNKNKVIRTAGTTVYVDSSNEDIDGGEYTTYLDLHTNTSNEKEWALFFDNGKYLLILPTEENAMATLIDLTETKEFPDNISFWHTVEGAKEAEEEVKNYKEYLAEQERIKNALPQIGMTKEQVEKGAWGKPTKINKTTYSWGITEQWCYPAGRYVYFENDIVTAISE